MTKQMHPHINYYLIPLVFFLTLFFFIPYELYYTAQEYWHWKKQIPLSFNAVGIISYLMLVICLRIMFAFFSERLVKTVSILFLFAGLFILFADVFAPLQTSLATGEQLNSTEPLFYTLVELIFFSALCIFFIKQPLDALARKGMIALCVLVCISLGYFFLVILSGKPENVVQTTPKASTGLTGNVYHILLDEMQIDAAQLYLDEYAVPGQYDGFIFYPYNIANYLSTHAAFPSYMTGSLFKKGSFETWYKSVYKDRGLLAALNEKGYQIRIYAYSNNWHVPFAQEFYTLRDIYEQVTRISDREYQDFIQIVTARSLPNILTREALEIGEKIGAKVYQNLQSGFNKDIKNIPVAYEDGVEPFSTVLAFRHLIESEKHRPANGQYVYFHSVLPHPPYVYDENGRYDLAYRNRGAAGYFGQVRYAFKQVETFLSELRRLGRYHDSTIIIHADTGHGSREGFVLKENSTVIGSLEKSGLSAFLMRDFFKTSDRVPEELHRYPKDNILSRTHALLMIKPAQSRGDIRVSDLDSQLVDIYPSMADLLDLPEQLQDNVEGISLFTRPFPENRPGIFFWFPQKETDPDVYGFNISNYRDRKNAQISFAGQVDEKEILLFPKEGIIQNVGAEDEGRLKLHGFSGKEKTGDSRTHRWGVGKNGQIVFAGLQLEEEAVMEFRFQVEPFKINENARMTLSTGLSSETVILKPGLNSYQIPLTFKAGQDLLINIAYEHAKSPESLGMGSDIRELAALWTKIALHFTDE